MSLTLHSIRHYGRRPTAAGRAPMASSAPAILRFARKAIVGGARLYAHAAKAVAEARMHQAMIEDELYLNRYWHSSKNDDDLPMVTPAPAAEPVSSISPRVTWQRAAGAVVAIAKRAYPAIIVLSILATVLAATMAIRLAIWLPLNWH